MPKIVNAAKVFRVNEVGPRFLLFLKNRGRSRSAELPAKTSSGIEAGTLIVLCFVLLALAVLVFQVLRQRG
jgi:hypothetical protein